MKKVRQTKQIPSMSLLRLENLSIEIMNRIGMKGQPLDSNIYCWWVKVNCCQCGSNSPTVKGTKESFSWVWYPILADHLPQTNQGTWSNNFSKSTKHKSVRWTPLHCLVSCWGCRVGPLFLGQYENLIAPLESEILLLSGPSSPVRLLKIPPKFSKPETLSPLWMWCCWHLKQSYNILGKSIHPWCSAARRFLTL